MRVLAQTKQRHLAFVATLLTAFILIGNSAWSQCGKERWSVKTGTDPDAAMVNISAVTPSIIAELRALPAPTHLPSSARLSPTEPTVFQLTCTLLEYKIEDDSDYHLVLSDAAGNTMIAEIPSPHCVGPDSPFAYAIANTRNTFDAKYHPTKTMHAVNEPVQITGIGFFDFIHGQTGVAPNGIELHPVLSITFGQPTAPSISEESPTILNRPPLTNADILALANAGFHADVLLAKIKTSKPQFDTSTNALIELKKAGVPPEVITEMIYREAGLPSPSAASGAPSSKQAAFAGAPAGSSTAATTTTQADPNVTVYVTTSGKKYHTQGCSSLRSSSIPMKLADAVAAGYTPCSRCNPPTLDKASASTTSSDTPRQGASVNPSDKPTGETTASGSPIYEGPRGGHYHYSKSGKKVYDHKK